MNAPVLYAGSPKAPFPPGSEGWPDLVDEETQARARELLELLPAWSYVDEGAVRYFAVVDGGRLGVAARFKDDGAPLGDAAAPATSPSSSSSAWFWVLGLGALALGGWALYAYAWSSPARAHASSAERRRERDDFAEANIPPELVHLWRRERSRFRGSPDERAEAFMEWAETDEGQSAAAELLEERGRREWERKRLEREGCTCNDDDAPHCCGRGCCSYHQGIRGRMDSEVPF